MKFIHFALLILPIHCVYAQNVSENYYNQFDQLVGSYQTDLTTGQRFEDVFLTNSDDEFRFFITKESVVGKVNYDSQEYFQTSLKYDLLDDNLLFKSVESSNQYDVILEPLLVNSFSFLGRHFVKLSTKASKFSFYRNGYFELLDQTDDFMLYLKHEKFKKKKLGDKTSFYTYSKKESFLLQYQSEFYEISSKNDIIKLLPEKKSVIKSFYKNNHQLESQNKIEFMKKLMTTLKYS